MAKVHVLVVLLATTCIWRAHSFQSCDANEFECKDGTCIAEERVCDSHRDCPDNSDERDCDARQCRKPKWFMCSDQKTCLPADYVCNGVENCPDGDDEVSCDGRRTWTPRNCTESEFTCDDKMCIPLDFMCDGVRQCHDGSDEVSGCLRAEHECSGFFCYNRRCLESHQWVCDGEDDCGDNSDEVDCVWNCKLDQRKFLCEDNDTCIDLDHVCDGKPDCHDRSDEGGKCNDTMDDCKSKNCPRDSTCHMLPKGAECLCSAGYKYDPKRNTCEDINECETYGICSQGCVNTVGSYRCTCAEKYKMKADNKTCVVSSGEPLLLYSTQKTIVGVHLKSRHVYTVADNLTLAIGVAHDGQNIYWTSIRHEDESIIKAREDGSRQEILLTSGLDAPEDLAVDWLTGNIYFTDNVIRHIAVCSNNGHYCTPLVVINVHQPRGIALWPQKGQMFWTDWGTSPMIASASMDGQSPVALVSKDIHWPNGITLDVHNDRLYWADAKLMTIESTRMDGSDRRLVLSDILKHPYGISVFEDNLYWSDWTTKSIHTCRKFSGKGHEVIAKDRRIYAVHVYHSANQPNIDHACKNRGCTHLCLLGAKNTSTCACPDGMALAVDRTRCIKSVKKNKLYVGLKNVILEMEHTIFGKHKVLQEHTLPMFIHRMAYNSVNGTILIADNIQKVIAEYDPINRDIKTLIRGNLGNVTGMAFDNFAQNLYWTDSERHSAEVYSMRTRQRAIAHFFAGVDVPIGLGLMPEEGKMFIALRSWKNMHIDQKTLGAHGDHIHVFEEIKGMGAVQIVLDHDSRTLYWVDTDGGRIEFSMFDDLHSYALRVRLAQPASIALVDEEVFWTTLRSPYLYWTHKSNLGSVKKTQIEVSSLKMVDRVQLMSNYHEIPVDHPCVHGNGGCSHVCVSTGRSSAACLCPSGLVFKNARNQTCIEALDCEFRCKSGECLTMSRRCNGRKDCPDGSDEEFCESKTKKTRIICALDEFMCHDSTQCVLNEVRCNKVKDCADGSDEEHCESFDDSKNCHKHQHVCDNGRCVDLSVICDGFNDCADKSDEKNCDKNNGEAMPKCGKDMFQCTSGTCIAKSWECDGRLDCIDGSDEHEKCVLKDCEKGMYKCRLGQCIDERLVCDGHNDCSDDSDEQNCADDKKKIVCGDGSDELDPFGKPKKFQCSSEPTICLDQKAVCNGTAECPRGEDELGCHGSCSVHEFQCKNGERCVWLDFRCDGEKDCSDNSDELSCDHYNTSTHGLFVKACEPGMFDCKDGGCIDESRVCDGHEDCTNGQDETKMCKTACLKGNSCEQKCHATPYGAQCGCFKGYKLEVDQKRCVDVNECFEGPNPCAQVCENTHGSYRCSCFGNFMLRTDKTSCKSLDSGFSVLFTTHNEIRSLSESPMTLRVLWSVNDSRITGLDMDITRKKLYYTVGDSNGLFEWSMEQNKLTGGLSVENPSKVAVDWITGNVYVISRLNYFRIKACNFERKLCVDIVKLPPIEIVSAIAVDAVGRKLFYAAVSAKGFSSPSTHVCISGLDGSSHTIIATRDALVTALEVDIYKKELYFVDAHSRTLQSVSYRLGSDRTIKTVVRKENAIVHPSAISIHENEAFIVNTGAREAVRCRLYGNAACKGFSLNVYNIEDIVINSPSRQRLVTNICGRKTCAGLCVQGAYSYECICQDGTIGDEYTTCHNQMSNEIADSFTASHPDGDASTSSAAAAVWYTLLGVVIVAGIAGYFYTRSTQGHRNFNINMHFQNPLSRFQAPSAGLAPPATGYNAGQEKLQFGMPIPRVLRGAKGTEIILETERPATGVQTHGTTARTASLLLEESDADSPGGLANFDDDQRKRLVP